MNRAFIIISLFISCSPTVNNAAHKMSAVNRIKYTGAIEQSFQQSGLLNVTSASNRFFVDLRYSDTANFLHQDVYGKLENCYLHQETLNKLWVADSLLQAEGKGYHFLIYDGARPLYIQQTMYDLYRKMPVAQGLYLSHPNHHSLHNYGAAVDLTICDSLGNPVDMGTDFDHFGEESHIGAEFLLVQQQKISQDAYFNRKLLRRIMMKAGFSPITFEWWHFNSCSRGFAATHYTLIK